MNDVVKMIPADLESDAMDALRRKAQGRLPEDVMRRMAYKCALHLSRQGFDQETIHKALSHIGMTHEEWLESNKKPEEGSA